MASEKSPLLRHESNSTVAEYGLPTERRQDELSDQAYVTVPPIGPDELPPPYSPSLHGGTPMISCKVCGFMIDVSGKKDQHVVKCGNCNEATPIKNAPPGKKYARCPCNCLLICKSSSQRIACPRPACKKIINLAPCPSLPAAPNVPGMCQVSCAHCHNLFLFNTLSNALARCPHCRKVSSVGRHFSRCRGIIFITLAFVTLAIALGVTVGTYLTASKHGGIFVVYTGLFVIAIVLFLRSVYYFTMKVSIIEGPV